MKISEHPSATLTRRSKQRTKKGRPNEFPFQIVTYIDRFMVNKAQENVPGAVNPNECKGFASNSVVQDLAPEDGKEQHHETHHG